MSSRPFLATSSPRGEVATDGRHRLRRRTLRSPGISSARSRDQDLVEQPVLDRLGPRHEAVAIGVPGNLLVVPARVVSQDAEELLAQTQDLLRLDGDVAGLPTRTAEGQRANARAMGMAERTPKRRAS